MASLPYITSPGNVDKALKGIISSSAPERVSGDFVKTILKIRGGSGDQMTSYLKKIGFVNSNGTPSDLYHKFRNPSSSGAAIASAIRRAYAPLYIRREYMHELDGAELTGLIVEETGLPHDANPVKLASSCIERLKTFADFEASLDVQEEQKVAPDDGHREIVANTQGELASQSVGINLGYTINLNLPATSDPAVFDAIFRSLNENILRKQNA